MYMYMYRINKGAPRQCILVIGASSVTVLELLWGLTSI